MNHAEIAPLVGKTDRGLSAAPQAGARERGGRASGRSKNIARPAPTAPHGLRAGHQRCGSERVTRPARRGCRARRLCWPRRGVPHGRIRNIGRPVVGRRKILALVGAIGRQQVPGPAGRFRSADPRRSSPPWSPSRVAARWMAILLSVADGKVQHIFLSGRRGAAQARWAAQLILDLVTFSGTATSSLRA